MKILRTNNSHAGLFNGNDRTLPRSFKKKEKRDEFKKTLEKTIHDQSEDLEEFRVLLPKHGLFWDNGYEDLE